MENILDWGIKIVLWLQQFSPALDLPFEAFTFTGGEDFLILLMPLFYWCLDRNLGVRLTFITALSTYLGGAAKLLANQPRPFQYDARVRQLTHFSGGGFPSLHTQSTVTVWGYLASQVRRAWLWALGGVLMILVPLSRIYLGVHFPTDIAGGYLTGVALLLLYLWLEPPASAWLRQKGLPWQLGIALVVPCMLALPMPADEEIGITAAAILMGMGIGFPLERRWVGFEIGGIWWKQGLRLLLGIVVLMGLRVGLKVAFASCAPEALLRFLRYVVISLWASLGAPWAFVKLGLAEGRPE